MAGGCTDDLACGETILPAGEKCSASVLGSGHLGTRLAVASEACHQPEVDAGGRLVAPTCTEKSTQMTTQARRTHFAFLMILIVAAFSALGFVILPTIASVDRAEEDAGSTPVEVVNDFYAWYIEYNRLSNPLSDRAYRDSDALTPDFTDRLDVLTSSDMCFDPFLCDQDVPDCATWSRAGLIRIHHRRR